LSYSEGSNKIFEETMELILAGVVLLGVIAWWVIRWLAKPGDQQVEK